MATQKNNKELIGKGLRSLLDNINTELKTTEGNLKTEVVNQVTQTVRIPVAEIIINPKQPRKHFNEEALKELAASIVKHYIIHLSIFFKKSKISFISKPCLNLAYPKFNTRPINH
jgi:ParB family chromosome partitioning protein